MLPRKTILLHSAQIYFLETFTDKRWRPFARRDFKTFLPAVVFMRFLKPCLRLALVLLGWKVLFIFFSSHLLIQNLFAKKIPLEKTSSTSFVNAKTFNFFRKKIFSDFFLKIVLQNFWVLLKIFICSEDIFWCFFSINFILRYKVL